MKELREVCKVIYGVILTVVTRRRFLKTKVKIVMVQKMVKVCVMSYMLCTFGMSVVC